MGSCWMLQAWLLVLPVVWCTTKSTITASTKYGIIRGIRTTTDYQLRTDHTTNTVDKYLGVPFAAPPIGDRRFAAPEEPDKWDGIRDATKHGWACPQMVFHDDTSTDLQNEDCLYLDIYAPYEEARPNERYPVMFYIHGGSFEVGSGRLYDGSVLAHFGVVVVSINYRLGALGFLSAADEVFQGNYGMKDQVRALKWVRDNIARFRGDPHKVTVFGHSAGGASVGLLLVIPETKDLFHGAIGQSGSAIATYSVHEKKNVDFGYYLELVGKLFGCNGTTLQLQACLRTIPAQRFIHKRHLFPLYDPIDPEFRPSVDGEFIMEHPRETFKKGNYHRVPIIVGTVQNEFGNYFNGGERYNQQFDIALDEYVLKFASNPAVDEVIKYVYTDWELDIYDRGSLLSDMNMVAPTVDMAELVSLHSRDIYQYHFATHNTYHSVELNYVFGAPYSGHFADEMTINGSVNDFDEKQRRQSTRMMKLWTNFAKYGEPTPHDPAADKWKEFKNIEGSYMHLNYEGNEIKTKLRKDKVVFWNKFVPSVKRKLVNATSGGSALAKDSNCESHWMFIAFKVTFPILLIIIVILLIQTALKKSKQRSKKEKPSLCSQVIVAEDANLRNDASSPTAECKAVLL